MSTGVAVSNLVKAFGVLDLTATPPTLAELFLRHYNSAPEATAAGAAR